VRECPGGKCTFTQLYDPTRLPKPPLSESGQTKFATALLRLAGRLACTAFPYLGRIVCIAHERFERRALYGRRFLLPRCVFVSLGLVLENSVAGSLTIRVGDYDPNVVMLTLRFFLTHGHE
jgi:hypothetical protein